MLKCIFVLNIIQYHEKYLFSIIYLFNDPNVFFRGKHLYYPTKGRQPFIPIKVLASNK